MGSFDEYLKKYDKQAGYSEGKGYKSYVEAEDLSTKAMKYAQKAVPYAQKQMQNIGDSISASISNMGNITSQAAPQYQNKPKPAAQPVQPSLRVTNNVIDNFGNSTLSLVKNNPIPSPSIQDASKVQTEKPYTLERAGKELGKSLVRGGKNVQAGFGSLLSQMAETALVQDPKAQTDPEYAAQLVKWAKAGREINQKAKDEIENLNLKPFPQYQGFEGLKNPVTFVPTVANSVMEQLPMLTGGAVGGLVGGPVGAAAGAGAMGATAQNTYLDDIAAIREKMPLQTQKVGGYGNEIDGLPLDNSVNMRVGLNNVPTVEEIQRTEALKDIINAGLEAINIGSLANRFTGGVAKNALKKVAKDVVEQGLTEGATETLQEVNEILKEKKYGINDANLKENAKRALESGAIGGLTGMVLGGAPSAYNAAANVKTNTQEAPVGLSQILDRSTIQPQAAQKVSKKIESIAPKTAAKQNKTTEQVTDQVSDQVSEQVTEQVTEPTVKENLTVDNNTFTSYPQAFKEMKKRGKGFTVVNNNDGTYTVALTGNVTKNVQKDVKENVQAPAEKVETNSYKESPEETKLLNRKQPSIAFQGSTWRELFDRRLDPEATKSWWIEKVYETPADGSMFAEPEFAYYKLGDETGRIRAKIPKELNKYIEEKFDTTGKYIYSPKNQSTQAGEMVETPATQDQNQIADTSKKVEEPKPKVEELAPNIAAKQTEKLSKEEAINKTNKTLEDNSKNSKLPKYTYTKDVSFNTIVTDGKYVSNGDFAMLADEIRMVKNPKTKVGYSEIEKLIPTEETKPFAEGVEFYKDNSRKPRQFAVLETQDGDKRYINKKYYDLVKNGATLEYIEGKPNSGLVVKKDGKTIGVIMPIQMRDSSNLTKIESKKTETETKEPVQEQAEVKQPETKVSKKVAKIAPKTAEKQAKKKESGKLEDAGEFLQGNRKLDTSLTWNELKDMNDLIRKKNTTKSKVYPKPTLEGLKEEGLSDFQAGIVLNVYNKINAKPAAGYDKIEFQKQYVDTVKEVMDSVKDYIKTHSDEFTTDLIADAARKARSWSYDFNKSLFDVVFPDSKNLKGNGYFNIFRQYPEYNRKAIIIGGNKFIKSLELTPKTLMEVSKAIEDSKKSKDSAEKTQKADWEKNFVILEPSKWENKYAVANKNNKQILAKYDTREEAIAAAQRVHEKIEKLKAESKKANFERDYVERRKNNKNVTTEELQKTFGFRGVNFGNWATAKERQDFANYAYDSLYDLAELLNLPPKALSLNGELGLAYGAQGHGGKAAAHYIPAFKDINLTKEYGAGSLAHEWWHALDNYFANKANKKEFSEDFSLSLREGGELRPELYEALENLQAQIKKSPFTEEDIKKNIENITARYERNIKHYADSIRNNYKKAKNADELLKIVDDLVENKEKYKTYTIEQLQEIENKFFKLLPENRDTMTNRGEFSWLTGTIRRLNDINELATKGANKSEYLQNAEKIDRQSKGKAYWSLDTELGARAFTSYIIDRMEKQDILNKFLARSEGSVLNMNAFKELAEGEERESMFIPTYPNNPQERERIFKAFDKLFDTIKTRETDKGVELYDIDFGFDKISSAVRDIVDRVLDDVQINAAIANGTKVSEIIKEVPELTPFLGNIKNYKVGTLNGRIGKRLYDTRGLHTDNAILINMEAIGDDKAQIVKTLVHEATHATQKKEYLVAKAKRNKTAKDLETIKNYEDCLRVNKKLDRFYTANKSVIDDVINEIKKLKDKKAIQDYVNSLDSNTGKIYNDFIEFYKQYRKAKNEKAARKNGNNALKEIIKNGRFNGSTRPISGGLIQRSAGTEIRNSSPSDTSKVLGRAKIKEEWEADRGEIDLPEAKTEKEIESDIENTAKELEDVKPVKRSVLKDVGHTIEKAITPISTRLEKINPVLKYAIRKFEYKLGQAENDYASQAKPFLDKLQEFSKKNPRDYKVYDLALKNGNKEHIDYLNKKYGLTEEYKQLRTLMDSIRQDAIDSGMDVGLIEEYYPRRFTDANKFLTEMQKHTQVAAKLKEYTNLSDEDKAIKINNALKGIGGVISTSSSHTKSRKISELQAKANAYYKDSQVALGEYIASMNKKIQMRKFFGQDAVSVSQLRTKLRNKKNTLDEVKGRSAAQSKFKELSRLKYELAPLKVKLESYNKQAQTPEIKEEVTKLKDKIDWLENQINWVNKTKDTIIHNVVKKRLREDIAAIEDNIKAKQNGNLEDSIGSYVKNLIDNNQITAEQENELKEILAARFNEKGMSESVAAFKNAGLITSMANGINSAITQIGDFAWTLYRNGFINSMAGLKEQFKDSGLTKQDLGIDKIAQEFETDSKSGKLVSNLFEKVGLEFIDSLGKETFINGTLESLRQEARKPSKEFTEKLNKMFDNPEQVINDLKNGEVNDDIKYLLFNEISDFQPITNAEMPQTYLTAGNGRIVYTLKSYTIKQFDVLRRECFDKYKKAQNDYKNAKTKEQKAKAKEDIKKSITDTIKLVSLIVVLNGGADAAKDFLLGRKFNLEDTFIDNILKLAFLNKFTTDKASKQGLWSMFVTSNFSIPQLAWLDDIGHDVKATKKAIDKNEDLGETIKDYKVWKNAPLVGKHYYNMLGGGAANKEKYQKQDDRTILQKEYMKPNNASGIMKAQRELQKKGYSAKDLKKMRDSARTTVKNRYKEKYVNAIERGDSRAIASISRELQNTSISPAERSKIYSSARKKALENRRRK